MFGKSIFFKLQVVLTLHFGEGSSKISKGFPTFCNQVHLVSIFTCSNCYKWPAVLPFIVGSTCPGGGFKYGLFIFTPKIGEMINFDLRIFFKWVGKQPPASCCLTFF